MGLTKDLLYFDQVRFDKIMFGANHEIDEMLNDSQGEQQKHKHLPHHVHHQDAHDHHIHFGETMTNSDKIFLYLMKYIKNK